MMKRYYHSREDRTAKAGRGGTGTADIVAVEGVE
jgi:hypothetical protein